MRSSSAAERSVFPLTLDFKWIVTQMMFLLSGSNDSGV